MEKISIIGLDLGQAGFSGSRWPMRRGRCVLRKQLKRCEVLAFFARLDSLRGGDGSLRDGALLGARDRKAWPRGAAYSAGLRQSLREARAKTTPSTPRRSARRRAGPRCVSCR